MTAREVLQQELRNRGLKPWTDQQPGEFLLAAVAAVEKLAEKLAEKLTEQRRMGEEQ